MRWRRSTASARPRSSSTEPPCSRACTEGRHPLTPRPLERLRPRRFPGDRLPFRFQRLRRKLAPLKPRGPPTHLLRTLTQILRATIAPRQLPSHPPPPRHDASPLPPSRTSKGWSRAAGAREVGGIHFVAAAGDAALAQGLAFHADAADRESRTRRDRAFGRGALSAGGASGTTARNQPDPRTHEISVPRCASRS